MKFTSTKVITLGSCAFRQPFATSHCKYIHGYRLQAKFWFACNSLDENNWVVDFGALKPFKTILESQFDHTTVIWAKDPDLQIFIDLNKRGIIDLRVMADGVGIEKFAQFCLEKGNEFIKSFTSNRCWVEKVEVWEHEQNSAVCELNNEKPLSILTTPSEQKWTDFTSKVDAEPIPIKETKLQLEPPVLQPKLTEEQKGANIYGVKTQGYKDLFAGTSWGNNSNRR